MNGKNVQVSFVKTIVGWFNVYLAGTQHRVTLKPEEFRQLFPNASDKVKYGCGEITQGEARRHFCANLLTEVAAA